MRPNPLHNALFLASTMLRAETIALKIVPDASSNWSATDIAVGDTAQLANLGWLPGDLTPELTDYRRTCLLYTSPSPRDATLSRMPSSA